MTRNQLSIYEMMGIASLLPSLVRAHEIIGEHIEELRARLAELQREQGHRVGRPPGTVTSGTRRSGWSADPEARSAEMRRRQAVHRGEAKPKGKALPTHPRDPRHPDHAQWKAKMSKARKKYWKSLSPIQRQEHLDKMSKGSKARAKSPEAAAA